MKDNLKEIFAVLVKENESYESKLAKESLISISQQDPQLFVTELLSIYKQTLNEQERVLIISHLSYRICELEKNVLECIWSKLTSELHEQIKLDLFQLLINEQMIDPQIALCNTIGKLAASLLREKPSFVNNQWHDFFPKLWQLFQHNELVYSFFGFRIISTILKYYPPVLDGYTEELKALFFKGLVHPDPMIASSSIDCICLYVGTTINKLTTELQAHVPQILEQYYHQSQKNQKTAEQILTSMIDLATVDSYIFKRHFEMILSAIWKINIEQQEKIKSNLLMAGIKLVVKIVKQYPSIVRQNKEYLTKLIDLILLPMVEIDEDIIESWKNPKEGFQSLLKCDSDLSFTFGCMSAIDSLIFYVGDKAVFPILFEKLEAYLAHSDWRYQFSSIMVLSQVSQYINDIETVKKIMGDVLPFLEKENPMIRYSVFQLIQQFSIDKKGKFSQLFKHTMIKMLLKFFDDPVPHVASHASYALSNFIEWLGEKDTKEYIEVIITKVLEMIDSEHVTPLMKESCLLNIQQCCQSVRKINPYVNRIMESLFRIINKNTNDSQCKQLQSKAINVITFIGLYADRKFFLPHLNGVIVNILKFQDSIYSMNDPSLVDIIDGWKRLVDYYPKEIKPHLPNVMNGIFKIIKLYTLFVGNEEITMDESQMNSIMFMLQDFIDRYSEISKNLFKVYAEKIMEIVLQLCKIYGSDLRIQIWFMYSYLVDCCRGNQGMLKKFLQNIQKSIRAVVQLTENDISLRYFEQIVMYQCLDQINEAVFTQAEIEYLVHFAIKILLFVDNELRIQMKRNYIVDVQNEEQEFHGNERKKIENQLQKESMSDKKKGKFKKYHHLIKSLEDSFWTLFRTHPEFKQPSMKYILEFALPELLTPLLKEKDTSVHSEAGLMLIEFLIKNVELKAIGYSKWDEFVEPLVMYCTSEVPRIRKYAARVIREYEKRTPKRQFKFYIDRFMPALLNGTRQGEDNNEITQDDTYYKSIDEMVVTIGQFIEHRLVQSYKVILSWINCQPLKRRKYQQQGQVDILIDVVLKNPKLFKNQESLLLKTYQILQPFSNQSLPQISKAIKFLNRQIEQLGIKLN